MLDGALSFRGAAALGGNVVNRLLQQGEEYEKRRQRSQKRAAEKESALHQLTVASAPAGASCWSSAVSGGGTLLLKQT